MTSLRNYTYVCPTCREPICNEIPNYSILSLLFNDNNIELLKQAINKQLIDLESTKQKLHFKYEKELKVSKIITDIIINETKLDVLSKQKSNFNQMDQKSLTNLKIQLDKIKYEINNKLDTLDKLVASNEQIALINNNNEIDDILESNSSMNHESSTGVTLVSTSNDITCNKCMQKLTGQFTVFEDKKYHVNCFKCSKCDSVFKDNIVFELNSMPLCSDCHIQNQIETASKCKKCFKPILETVVTFKNAEYHDECFKCEACEKRLNGESIYSDNKQNRNYCADCFSKKESKICDKCMKIIMPNQIALIYIDKHFHEGDYIVFLYY